MANELTVAQTRAIGNVNIPVVDDGFGVEDLKVSMLRLLQGLSQSVVDGKGSVGEYQDSVTNEVLGDSVELVFFKKRKGAVYFKQGEGRVCRSEDGIESINGDKCVECPFGQYWGKKWKRGEKGPECCSTVELFAITRESLTEGNPPRPLIVSFMKTSHKVGLKIVSMLAQTKLKAGAVFARSFVLGSEIIREKKGTYAHHALLTAADGSPDGAMLTPPELQRAMEWYAMFNSANIAVADTGEEVAHAPESNEESPF